MFKKSYKYISFYQNKYEVTFSEYLCFIIFIIVLIVVMWLFKGGGWSSDSCSVGDLYEKKIKILRRIIKNGIL